MVTMKCCNTSIAIDTLYNKSLCPNCNSLLDFIIEKIPNSSNSKDTEADAEANADAAADAEAEADTEATDFNIYTYIIDKKYDIEIIFPLILIGVSVFTALQACMATYP